MEYIIIQFVDDGYRHKTFFKNICILLNIYVLIIDNQPTFIDTFYYSFLS